jgi:hypothetical protein
VKSIPGYIEKEVVFSPKQANLSALRLMLPLVAITGIPYYLIWSDELTFQTLRDFAHSSQSWLGYGMPLIILTMILGIVAHELIHGITWALFAKKGFKSIQFGMLWKEVTPYCHCGEPLKVKHYVAGALMPALLLGITPTLAAYVTGNVWLMLFGLFFTAAAAGDFLIVRSLRSENPDDLVQDHSTAIGYYIFRKLPE